MDESELEVVENEPAARYELRRGDETIGLIDYREQGGTRAFVHTEVRRDLEGRGYGGVLVGRALDDLRAKGIRVVPACPFVGAHIRRHPEYSDLLAD
jgi:predicted GNAT family acetyltransferase